MKDKESNGRLAQLGEHLPYKQGVTGSSPVATTIYIYGPVVQLVRTLACHARGRRFEPVPGRHFFIGAVKLKFNSTNIQIKEFNFYKLNMAS